MTKTFIARVIKAGIVDTRNYRYICKYSKNRLTIYRLSLDQLDTTAALKPWETVYTKEH